MGVKSLTIVDNDLFEAGNMVRHKLDLNHINREKASALAHELNSSSPTANCVGLTLKVPSNDPAFMSALAEATLVIDATASDDVLRALPFARLSPDVPIISCSLGLYAKRLFLYSDFAKEFSWEKFNRWFEPYREEEDKLAQTANLPRDKGCWHPLTPAPLNRIAGLSGMAVEFIEQIYTNESMLPIELCHDWPDLDIKR